METFRVLVSDKLSEQGLAVFKAAAPRVEVDYKPGLGKDPKALGELIGAYHGLAIRSGTEVTAELIARADKLKVIGRAGIGVDNVDIAAASRRGIVVMNTPDGNVVTTAEHAIALMCALARKIPQATASMRAGQWEKTKFEGRELADKTLGVVGLGNIGKIVAQRGRGLKMRVVAYDPFVSRDKAQELGVELLQLDELLARADVVTLHVPLLDGTRNLIDGAAIEKMKKGALLVNAARGGLVDEAAVAAAITSKRLGGAAFDVFLEEPPRADNPLLALEDVILTPHLGASTSEAQENVAVAVAQQIVDLLVNGTVRNALNAPTVPPELAQVIGPYVALGSCLAGFAAQIHPGELRTIRVAYHGEAAELKVAPITMNVLAHALRAHLARDVNAINAPVVAKERGIQWIEEKHSEAHDFVSTVTVRIEGAAGTTEVMGAIFGHKEPRIVRVNGLDLELVPQGFALLTQHSDQPGIIGQVGTVLGAAGINISRMALSQGAPERARAAITIDSAAPDEIVAQIRGIRGIDDVRLVKLG